MLFPTDRVPSVVRVPFHVRAALMLVGLDLNQRLLLHAAGRPLTVAGRAANPTRGENGGDAVVRVPDWTQGGFLADHYSNIVLPPAHGRIRIVYGGEDQSGYHRYKHGSDRGLELLAKLVALAMVPELHHDVLCPCMHGSSGSGRRRRRSVSSARP